MKIIKKIKRFLGLELPHLLEDEEEEEVEIRGNILKTPEIFYKTNTWENIEQLNKAMLKGSISINEARELLNIGRNRKCLVKYGKV